ncbi:ribosome silencing factor [Fluviispira multicolorata]|uniref:Ribosomal silencing factor RsfS n=1 Tax=Fluviispira multicolorata TaxID=2654512 RepID=A0A833JAX4_9BACT|nr:ribosome silencing factor [Fluviispira multicolorata]KAB8027758.1 ribosome silencing factor [Fluviispira multicolorata]
MTDFSTSMMIGERSFTHEEIAMLAIAAAEEKKAVRPVVMDLTSQGAFTELFAILSASNTRQVYAAAEAVRHFFKTHFGMSPVTVDGMENCTWVLIDYGFLFVHIFQEPTRELYQLEQLWSKAHMLPVSEDKCQELYKEVINLTKSMEVSDDQAQEASL